MDSICYNKTVNLIFGGFVMSKRIAIRIGCAILATLLLVVLGYVAYVFLSYYRVEDNLSLGVSGDGEGSVPVGEKLTLVTYNIGFGAYSDDYSFFMDGGEHSRAYSRDAVIDNTNGSIDAVKNAEPHFVVLQEVDIDGTRSYGVDQTRMFSDSLSGYDDIFAQNYDSPYFLYPFSEPIGANRSGLMTFSRFAIESATRRSLPIEDTLYKLLDLDRAYSVSVIPTENGKSLVLYNVHLSAYTSDGTIADEQLRMLAEDMSLQYEKGNYVIAAGDFNKDLLGDSSQYFERASGEFNWAKAIDLSLLSSEITCHSGTNAPTCRNADSPYKGDGSDFVLSVDGLLVSDNIEISLCETIDTGFRYSDHNPVRAEFILKFYT